MKLDRDVLRERRKIRVRRENFQSMPDGHRANQQIGSRARHSALTKPIVVTRSSFVVFFIQRKVRIKTKIIPQLFKALRWMRPGKQLLPDRPQQLHGVRSDQTRHFLSHRAWRNFAATEEFGPPASIDNDLHARFRRIPL